MSRTTSRWITAAGLLAGVVVLAVLATRPPWASAQASEAGEVLVSEDAGQCGPDEAPSPDAEIAALIQQDLRAAQQREPGPSEGTDVVVLNNRGYNYGPPPGVRFDALLPERGPKASESAR